VDGAGVRVGVGAAPRAASAALGGTLPMQPVQCAFLDRNLHSQMSLVHTPACLKRACV
jgi:hypothetical protein